MARKRKQAKTAEKGKQEQEKRKTPAKTEMVVTAPGAKLSTGKLTVSTAGNGRPAHSFHAILHPHVRGHLMASGKSNRVAAMLHQVAEPTTSLLIRTRDPSSITPEGTALAKLTSTFDTEWGPRITTQLSPMILDDYFNLQSSSKIGLFDDRNHYGLILTRSPIVPLITRVENKKAGGLIPTYQLSSKWEQDSNVFQAENVGYMPITGLNHVSGEAVYGNYAPNCLHQGIPGVWIDSASKDLTFSSRVKISLNVFATVGTNVLFVLPVLLGPTSAFEGTAVAFPSAISGSFTIVNLDLDVSGYYAFKFTNESNAPIPFTVSEATVTVDTAFVMRHHMLTSRETLSLAMRNCRVNGSSVLIKNRSPVIVQGGTVYAAQLPGSVSWYDSFRDLSTFTEVNVGNRWMGDWSKGAYGFVMPQGSEGGSSPLSMTKVVSDANWQASGSKEIFAFDPWEMGGMVAYIIAPPVATEPTFEQYSAANATIQVCQALEYSTTLQIVNVARSPITFDEYGMFLDALNKMPQFYENPLHIKDIWSTIKTISGKIVEWTPRILKVVGGLSDFASIVSAL